MSLLLQNGRHRGAASLSSPPSGPWQHLDFFVVDEATEDKPGEAGKIYVYIFKKEHDWIDERGAMVKDHDGSLGAWERFGG